MQKQIQRRKNIEDLLDFCSMFFTDSHHVTPMFFPRSLFSTLFFTPLTPSRSLAAPRGAGSSIGSGLLCNLGETRSYSNKWRSFTIITWFLNILYTFSVFLDEILRKIFTRSLSISKSIYLISLFVRLQVVSTLSKHSNYWGVVSSHCDVVVFSSNEW